MADSLRLLSLCSGIGWLDIGIRLAFEHWGMPVRTVAYVEREAYAAAILLARMEDTTLEPAPVWCGNLEDVRWGRWRGAVDIIAAGFPCQPWSCAGQRKGRADARWLWPHILRCIVDVEPRYVCLENVPGLVSGGGLEHVLSGLAENGFDATWLSLTAAAVGASHRRERIFILANSRHGTRSTEHREQQEVQSAGSGECGASVDNPASPRRDRARRGPSADQRGGECVSRAGCEDVGDAASRAGCAEHDGFRAEVLDQGCGELANTGDSGGRAQQPGTRPQGGTVAGGAGQAMADSKPESVCEATASPSDGEERAASPRASLPLFAPGPADGRWAEIVADNPHLAPAIESGFRVVVDGKSLVVDESRADQLRAAGNGVVAAQAAVAFAELLRRIP